MALLTVIGRGVRVRGRIQGEGDLTIEGHVEGEISVSGALTVDPAGLVGANINARVIVVRGAVRGDLTADDVVRLEEGARVVGDVHAPRIAIAKGALVRGLVQTGAAGTTASRGKTQEKAVPAARPASPPASAARRPVAAAPPVAPKPAAAPAARPAPSAAPQTKPAARLAPPSVLAGTAPATAKTPPPPVVPALKKGAKAALKKKAT
jgi:cytoskeletal protein CcmA (bactofilin family)